MTTWFTSDTHAGHPLVAVMRGFIKDYYLYYDFNRQRVQYGIESARESIKQYASHKHIPMAELADVENHDNAIIANINSKVAEDDELYMLGDIAFRAEPEYVVSYLDRIKCRHLHMIIGNHDFNFHDPSDSSLYDGRFESIDSNARIKMSINGKKQEVNLSHFPYREQLTGPGGDDRSRYYDAALPDDGRLLLFGHTHSSMKHNDNPHCLHVGLDAWNLSPVSMDDVDAWFSTPVDARS